MYAGITAARVNGTPIFDIKPYLPYADAHPDARGGFGEAHKDRQLNVTAGDEIRAVLEPELFETVCRLIAMDPRTAFIHDEERIWGLSYEGWNIRFKVAGNTALITEISRLTR